jgi:hypothetical protein
MDSNQAKDFIKFQTERKITNLYKQCLFILEDLNADGGNISNEKFTRIRKRILDYGNDAIRELQEVLDKFEVTLVQKG